MAFFDNNTNKKTSDATHGLDTGSSKSANSKLRKYKIKLESLSIFSQQLSSMLKAGLSLAQSLETITSEMEDKKLQEILFDIRSRIFSGEAFSESLKLYTKAFPPLFFNMVEAGETAGVLAEAMNSVSDYFSASLKLTKKVKSALVYPITIISLSIALVCALMIWVVPIFGEMFSGFGAQLPWLTRQLLNFSNLLQSNVIILTLLIVFAVFCIKEIRKWPKFSDTADMVCSKIPIFGSLLKKTNIARFCKTYSVLLESGVPILRAIGICSNVANNYYITAACDSIKMGIEEGKQLSVLLEEITYFPKMVSSMIKAGEQSGNVEAMVSNVAELYEADVNNVIASLTSLMEPFIICFLGVIIGGIVVAMFLPIFQLSSLVK